MTTLFIQTPKRAFYEGFHVRPRRWQIHLLYVEQYLQILRHFPEKFAAISHKIFTQMMTWPLVRLNEHTMLFAKLHFVRKCIYECQCSTYVRR